MACSRNCKELAFCICLGFFGVHKFYSGNWKCGLIYAFTLGILLVGVCVDFFLILFFWKEQEEENKISLELKNKKGNINKEQLLLYSSANQSLINYKYSLNKGKTACASASGICCWLTLGIIIVLGVFSAYPFVPNEYYKNFHSDQFYENFYSKIDSSREIKTEEVEMESKDRKKIFNKLNVYYPYELLQSSSEYFPLVIVSNPEGVNYLDYDSVFRHLASYGFIVVGNDDLGAEDETLIRVIDKLHKMNNDHYLFKNKFNLNEIGLIGYYQGSLPVINLLTTLPYNNSIAAAYVSCLRNYDLDKNRLLEKVKIISTPIFQTGPKKGFNYKSIMEEIYAKLNSTEKLGFLRKGKDQGSMVIYGDPYMTAWFDYKLKRNLNGSQIFNKTEGEIFINKDWENIDKS